MKNWKCRIGWHRWAKRLNDSGETYLVCRRCAKYTDMPTHAPTMGS
jgi:hypothetical protein